MKFTLNVNGESRSVDVDAKTPLLWVLRDELELKGTKFGCGMSLCGACTVHMDGAPIRACMTPVSTVGQARITTIEGVGATPVGAKVQAAWLDVDVVQDFRAAERHLQMFGAQRGGHQGLLCMSHRR